MSNYEYLKGFYEGRRVLVTGHTGFIGAWLCKVLTMLGAEVVGYGLKPNEPSVYNKAGVAKDVTSVIGDIRDLSDLKSTFEIYRPEVIFHLAAQPIILDSYERPVYTYDVNVMGTVKLLECARLYSCVKSIVVVTTDKIYENLDREESFTEEDRLNGRDPYSNSKSCQELVAASFARSFLFDKGVAVSTMRIGNTIGGGDYGKNRIIPDCARAASKGIPVVLRNPDAIRIFQHVLEPVNACLMTGALTYGNLELCDSYNVGPTVGDYRTIKDIVDLFCEAWEKASGRKTVYEVRPVKGPYESKAVRLNCDKIKEKLGIPHKWDLKKTVEMTAKWYYAQSIGEDLEDITISQINEYYDIGENKNED